MKKRFLPLVLLFVLMVAVSTAQAQGEEPEDPLAVLGTGFTYQGQLTDDAGSPLNGACDFNFSLWDALSGGAQVGAVSPVTNVAVAEGYFNAVVNGAGEFGSNAFKGSARWLEIALRCPAGSGSYTTLTPRQALTAAPYARYAVNAPWSGLSGVPADLADGDADTTYTAGTGLSLSGGVFSLAAAYRLPQSCTDGQIAEWDTGSSAWVCAADNTNTGDITSVTAGTGLSGGGTSGAVTLALGTAYQLPQSCTDGKIAEWDTGTSQWTCGTDDNSTYTAGTGLTLASGAFSVNFGGNGNATTAAHSDHIHSTYWLITGNSQIDPSTNYIGTRDNAALVFKVNAQRVMRFEPNATSPSILGGYRDNSISAGVYGATISGGGDGQYPNEVTGNYGTVGGGYGNTAAESAVAGGGGGNTASGTYSTIGGGLSNVANADDATVSGGLVNVASGERSSIGGGSHNAASGEHASIGGGNENTASAALTTIGGGDNNKATGLNATVGGGEYNFATGESAFIGGGSWNSASGTSAVVAGGDHNMAAGDYSFVAGRRALNNTTTHDGVFLFADSNDFAFNSTTANQFRVRATGGAQIVTGINTTTGAVTAGVEVAPGDGSWSSLSDRSLKANFTAVDGRAVLEAVTEMPISTWNYIAQDASIRHIGPMAQDFYAAFNVGADERHISSVDADGVALAAIQGLNQVVAEKETRIAALEAQVADLQQNSAPQASPLSTPWPWLTLCVTILGLALILRRRPAR